MSSDKYSAVWVSHTSISDFLQCPRAYYLKHVYKDPSTNHKIKLMSPPLALGQVVHEVIESLSILPVDKRFDVPLIQKFEQAWKKVKGPLGGFNNAETEQRYNARGMEMLKRVSNNPGPIARQAVKIKMDLPNYWLSEEENIILCGKIDWLEYLPVTDGVNIIDFKTGKNDEDGDSLQLPIYLLLVSNTQKRKVEKASYWYLERSDDLTDCPLPNMEDANKRVLDIARKIKLARTLEKFACTQGGGCNYCRPYEAILTGGATLVGADEYNADVYILNDSTKDLDTSVIL
ncbi:MAG: PD-(D/E)XK nuclease family protein [Candidatus Levybacteria bacterium]|nr:PD-(D/E)XK nuclease family protein [Candidatus Levybacteria bacterium]